MKKDSKGAATAIEQFTDFSDLADIEQMIGPIADEAPDAVQSRHHGTPVAVRSRVGAALTGVEAYGDGITFRSDAAIAGGRQIDLVICETILVEAEVVGCVPMPLPEGGHLVRARFVHTTPAMNDVICKEVTRLLGDPT